MSIQGVGTCDEGRPGTGLRQEYEHTGGGVHVMRGDQGLG